MFRLFLASFVAFFAWVTTYWFGVVALPVDDDGVLASRVAVVAALAAAAFAWFRFNDTGLVASVLRSALTFGAVGFAIGFFGPFLLNPEQNLGPLVGIFITGPLAFLVGGAVGLFRGLTTPS